MHWLMGITIILLLNPLLCPSLPNTGRYPAYRRGGTGGENWPVMKLTGTGKRLDLFSYGAILGEIQGLVYAQRPTACVHSFERSSAVFLFFFFFPF